MFTGSLCSGLLLLPSFFLFHSFIFSVPTFHCLVGWECLEGRKTHVHILFSVFPLCSCIHFNNMNRENVPMGLLV